MEENKIRQNKDKDITVRELIEETDKNNIVFDHPIQRASGQWDGEQKSLLIHSILADYFIPQIFAVQIDMDYDNAFSILDGKQRLTTIYDYVKGTFKLMDDMDTLLIRSRETIIDENGKRHPIVKNNEYDISGKYFSDLDGKLQQKIMDHPFSFTLMSNCSDEDIENQFYRLNNGTPLTADQKARIVLGNELAKFIETQERNDFFIKKSHFTRSQIKGGSIQGCILQTLMLIMDYNYKDIGNPSIMLFAEWFRKNQKPSDLDYCNDIFTNLNQAIPDARKPHKLMKKTHIPIIAYHVQTADEIGMSMEDYGRCIISFLDVCMNTEYENYCGAGSYKKEKVKARLDCFGKYVRNWKE